MNEYPYVELVYVCHPEYGFTIVFGVEVFTFDFCMVTDCLVVLLPTKNKYRSKNNNNTIITIRVVTDNVENLEFVFTILLLFRSF